MKKHLVSLFIVLAFSVSASSQPDTLWTKTYGGSEDDYGNSVQQTTDGGYIVAGSTHSFGAGLSNIFLIKTDADGDTVWTRIFGGFNCEFGSSVQQTDDGGYIVTGSTMSFGAGDSDVYLIKTDANGDTLWTRTYGGVNRDDGNDVQQTQDGGYIITCETWSYGAGEEDVYLIKTDINGDALWTRTFGGFNCDEGLSVRQTSDGGYIIVGGSNSYVSQPWHYDVYLIKTDVEGNALWMRTFGGDQGDIGYSIQQTPDEGYIIAGGTVSYGAGGFDVYLIKTDAVGDTLWTRAYGGSNSEEGYSVQLTIDGGYIIAGYTYSYGAGNKDVYVIKTDALGDTVWTKTVGGSAGDKGYGIQQTTDGGYIIAGRTESYGAGEKDVYLIRLDSEATNPDVTVTLTWLNPPVIWPIQYTADLTNNEPSPITFDAWIMVRLPNGLWYGPVLGPVNLTLSPSQSISRNREQNVPQNAPAGEYLYEGRIGVYPDIIWDSDGFTFIKLSSGGDSFLESGWECWCESFDDFSGDALAEVADDFSLLTAYPNPFNLETNLTFDLPEARNVSLVIYDIQGREVIRLVDEWYSPGTYHIAFDGILLSSGIYFANFTAGNFQQTRKIILLK